MIGKVLQLSLAGALLASGSVAALAQQGMFYGPVIAVPVEPAPPGNSLSQSAPPPFPFAYRQPIAEGSGVTVATGTPIGVPQPGTNLDQRIGPRRLILVPAPW